MCTGESTRKRTRRASPALEMVPSSVAGIEMTGDSGEGAAAGPSTGKRAFAGCGAVGWEGIGFQFPALPPLTASSASRSVLRRRE